jgi:hypothetical protein
MPCSICSPPRAIERASLPPVRSPTVGAELQFFEGLVAPGPFARSQGLILSPDRQRQLNILATKRKRLELRPDLSS